MSTQNNTPNKMSFPTQNNNINSEARDCCGYDECERPICDECEESCIGSAVCTRCETDYCTDCEVGGDDGTPEQEWVCDDCLEEIADCKNCDDGKPCYICCCDKAETTDDDEVTHWRVFDCAWELDAKRGQIGDYWDNHEDFDTLEEATAEFKDRCKLYKDTHNDEVDAVYLEEMGGGEEYAYSIDTVEYWERMSTDEYTKLHSFCDKVSALNFDDIEESIRQIEIAAKAVYDSK